MSAVTELEMEAALLFLAESDERYARAKALHSGLTEQRKIVKAQCFLASGASSATAREQEAYASPRYADHITKITSAEQDYLFLQAQRTTQATIIDCWRSLNAARYRA